MGELHSYNAELIINSSLPQHSPPPMLDRDSGPLTPGRKNVHVSRWIKKNKYTVSVLKRCNENSGVWHYRLHGGFGQVLLQYFNVSFERLSIMELLC